MPRGGSRGHGSRKSIEKMAVVSMHSDEYMVPNQQRYPGECPACHHPLYMDESVTKLENGYIHVRCLRGAQPRPTYMKVVPEVQVAKAKVPGNSSKYRKKGLQGGLD